MKKRLLIPYKEKETMEVLRTNGSHIKEYLGGGISQDIWWIRMI